MNGSGVIDAAVVFKVDNAEEFGGVAAVPCGAVWHEAA